MRGSLAGMAGELIYAFRVMRLPLLDAGGAPIGRLEDIVVIPGRPGVAPRVLGFVATSQRRRIFVNAGRLAGIDSDGARLRSWDVDLNPFKPKAGEVLIGRDIIDRRIGDETVSDVAMRAGRRRPSDLVAAGQGSPLPAQRVAPAAELPTGRRRRTARALPHSRVGGRRGGRPVARHAPQRRRRHRPIDAAEPAQAVGRGDGRRAPGRPARGASRGRAAAHHRRARPRAPGQRARRDGSTTTSPTCWPRCPASSARGSSRRWTPKMPTWCAAC